jgi:hypothetical protein
LKYWRLKYRFNGREKVLALGVYPEVTLAKARVKRGEARRLLSDGKDPSSERTTDQRARKVVAENSFETVAREWIDQQCKRWTERHADRVLLSLKRDIFPDLGRRPIGDIDSLELLEVLRPVEAGGVHETACRLLQC